MRAPFLLTLADSSHSTSILPSTSEEYHFETDSTQDEYSNYLETLLSLLSCLHIVTHSVVGLPFFLLLAFFIIFQYQRTILQTSSLLLILDSFLETCENSFAMSSTPQPTSGPWTVAYSNAGISQTNTTFYYDDQVLHWLANHGLPLVNATIGSIDASNWYNTAVAINYSAQAGACGVMFFVVLVLSQKAKRGTPIFVLNALSLLLGFLRGLFGALYFISDWVKLYPYFTNDFSAIPTRAYTSSVLSTIWPLLMTITVNLSLVLQAYTVTKSMTNMYRFSAIAISSLVWLMAVGFKFAEVVLNDIAIIQAKYYTKQWARHGALYMETISVWYFSLIFTTKLVYTLYYRKKHGWTQWSGVKILAAMGGCTMIIPCKSSNPYDLSYLSDPLKHSSQSSNMSKMISLACSLKPDP